MLITLTKNMNIAPDSQRQTDINRVGDFFHNSFNILKNKMYKSCISSQWYHIHTVCGGQLCRAMPSTCQCTPASLYEDHKVLSVKTRDLEHARQDLRLAL